jgi:hypothetical protein
MYWKFLKFDWIDCVLSSGGCNFFLAKSDFRLGKGDNKEN